MSAVAEHDPYLLPLPGPGTPVIRDDLIVGASNRGNARYSDPRWPLDLLSGNPSGRRTSIVWSNCPAVFEAELRLAVWNLINGQLRPSFIKQKKKRAMRQRISVSHLYVTVLTWMDLASWLAAQGISTLGACGPDMLDAYARHLADVINQITAENAELREALTMPPANVIPLSRRTGSSTESGTPDVQSDDRHP